MHPSAHLDRFARDHLPPQDQWPELVFELPELQFGLFEAVVAGDDGIRPQTIEAIQHARAANVPLEFEVELVAVRNLPSGRRR